ncbi:MAG: DUF2933 domain-containing protein [Nocardioides sp.]|nr:DUF2933 domain-containing protein [Nocardioides sp.]
MNKRKYPAYGIMIVAGVTLAVWAGMLSVFLLLLLCPLMIVVMMWAHITNGPRGGASTL